MSVPKACCNPCPDVQVENIPGVEGDPGTDGTDGSPGVSAFTLTTSNFNLPGSIGDTVTFLVATSAPFVIDQNIVVGDGVDFGTFRVVSLPSSTSIEGQWLGYPNDAVAGSTIDAGAKVSPGGFLPTLPVDIANGGTSASTKAGAQAALGLGQNATVISDESIAYDITAPSPATVTGITLAVPATGLYLVLAWLSIDFTGVTFAGSRTITTKVRNTTAGADVVSTARATGIQTTNTFPSLETHTPFITANLTAGDTLALQVGIDVVESAGSSVVNAASLMIIPLALA